MRSAWISQLLTSFYLQLLLTVCSMHEFEYSLHSESANLRRFCELVCYPPNSVLRAQISNYRGFQLYLSLDLWISEEKNENRMSRMENLHREREVNPYNLLLHVNTTNALRFYSDTFHIYVRKIPEKHCKNFIFIFINPHFFWMLQNFQ